MTRKNKRLKMARDILKNLRCIQRVSATKVDVESENFFSAE